MLCTWSAMALIILTTPGNQLPSGRELPQEERESTLATPPAGLIVRNVRTTTIEPCPPPEKPCC